MWLLATLLVSKRMQSLAEFYSQANVITLQSIVWKHRPGNSSTGLCIHFLKTRVVSKNIPGHEFYCCVMYSGVEYIVCCYSECISHTRQAEKSAWPRWESNPRPLNFLKPTLYTWSWFTKSQPVYTNRKTIFHWLSWMLTHITLSPTLTCAI